MAYTSGYTYDIFISYAHVDNIAFPGQADGWIIQFYKNLNLMLAKRSGRLDTVKIWWDNKKLDGSVLFDSSIEEGIKQTAIMICLNSPGYSASDYCKKELDTFYKKAQQEKTGLKVGDRSRIINVLLNNIPYGQWPSALNGTSGFPFHDAKEPADFGDTVDTLSPEFRTEMQLLRDAVWQLLNDFPKDKKDDLREPEEAKDNFTIFIGEVADTLRAPRKRVMIELEKKGYKLVTGIPPPDEAVAHELATKEALNSSDLSIHLLDEIPGREIIGSTEISYPQKQAQLSLASGKSQMIWVPAETDFSIIEEEKYKLFLEEIENGKQASKKYQFVRGYKNTLAQDIVDFAEKLKSQQASAKPKEKLSVYLDTHEKDYLYALDLGKYLFTNQVQTFINPQEDDPRKNINYMGERLSQVRKLIFLYGNVSKEWIRERISAALQLIITNNYPIEDFFIYMAPPHKEAADININQRFLKVNMIDNSNSQDINELTLNQFLKELKSGV